MIRLGRIVLPVTDLDGALEWYRSAFGFTPLFDREIFSGFRSVHIGSGSVDDPGIWLFPVQVPQARSEPALVLYDDDLLSTVDRFQADEIVQPVAEDAGRRSVQVRDPWGNIIVLAEAP